MTAPNEIDHRISIVAFATALVDLIRLLLPGHKQVELVGYLLMYAIAKRTAEAGEETTIAEVQCYVAEAVASGLDVGTGMPGHAVAISMPSRGIVPPSC